MGLAERRLGLKIFGIDEAFDDDLGFGRDKQIDGPGRDHFDGCAGERAGDGQFVLVLGHLLNRAIGYDGRASHHHGAGHGLAPRLPFAPMQVAAGPKLHRCIDAEPVRRLDLAPVIADVLNAGIGILGDEVRRRGIGRVVPARRRYRHRNVVEPLAVGKVRALKNDLLTGGVGAGDGFGGQRIGERLGPLVLDLFQGVADTQLIDGGIAREAANQNRNIEFPPLAIDDVGEQECLAILFRDAAAVLPAHQGVHLGVLVDGTVDLDQQARRAERRDMLVEVAVSPLFFSPTRHQMGLSPLGTSSMEVTIFGMSIVELSLP